MKPMGQIPLVVSKSDFYLAIDCLERELWVSDFRHNPGLSDGTYCILVTNGQVHGDAVSFSSSNIHLDSRKNFLDFVGRRSGVKSQRPH